MGTLKDWYAKNEDWAAPAGVATVSAAALLAGAPLSAVAFGAKSLLSYAGDRSSLRATKDNQADINSDLEKANAMVGKEAQLRPELSESIAEARKLYQEGRIRAETGFDPAQKAAFESDLSSQIKGDRMAAMEAGGGQSGNYIQQVLNNRKANTLLDFASKDAMLKQNKVEALNPLYNNIQQNANTVQGQQNLYDQALAKSISDLKLNKYMLREDVGQKKSAIFNKMGSTLGDAMKMFGSGGEGGGSGSAPSASSINGSMAETGNYNEIGTMIG